MRASVDGDAGDDSDSVDSDDGAALLRRLRDRRLPPDQRAAEVRSVVIGDVNDAAYRVLCTLFLDEHEEPAVRCAAAEALGRNEATAAMAVNILTRAVQATRKERPVRRAALAALRARGRVPARAEPRFQEALARLSRPGDQLERYTILNMACSYGYDPRALAALQRALGAADLQLRIGAVNSLAQLGETEAVLGAFDDPSPEVRAWAARMLGYYGLGEAREVAALERARGDTDASVVEAATVSLRRLGALPIRRPAAKRRPSAPAGGDDPRFPWRPLLERWSREWLQDADYAAELPDAVVESGWLGYPPASEAQIATAERRLGATLPPSYRAFLRVTNGWRRTSPFIERLWDTEQLEWLSVRNRHLIDVWTVDEMPDCWEWRALPGALEVSDWGDAALYVLHPGAIRADGEWEAGFFANWHPGAQVYGSFWELMQAEYDSFLQLRGDRLA